MAKRVITESVIRDMVGKGEKKLVLEPGSIVTPLAADLIQRNGIVIAETKREPLPTPGPAQPTQPPTGKPPESGVVVIGSDHGGFHLKEALRQYIRELGYQVDDVGTFDEQACDYPDFAYAVAIAVSTGKAWRGIMIDGAGIGSAVVANKVPGVRAACCHNEFVARNAREHNDTNVLTLGSKVTGSEVCKEIVRIWLESWFSGGRHAKRVDKIRDVEQRFVK